MKLGRTNMLVWAGLVAGILVLAGVYRDHLFEQGGRLQVVTKGVPADAVLFRWQGKIGPPMQTLIGDAFTEWRDKKRRIVLSLSSPGGYVSYGRDVIAQLDRIKRTHRLDTVVEGRNTCLSMCVPIYLQGQTRYAAPESRWMFHEPRAVDVVRGERIRTSRRETAADTVRFIDDFLRPAGVSEPWLRHLGRQIRGRDYWRTGRQLVQDDAGIIDKLI